MPDTYTPRVKELLRRGACRFPRHGKGDHEIRERADGSRFMVDHPIKSRHWANHTLKQAGLPQGVLRTAGHTRRFSA